MKKTLLFLTIIFTVFFNAGFAQSVKISYLKTQTQSVYAAGMLGKALFKKGIGVKDVGADFEIELSVDSNKLGREAYAIMNDGKIITVKGGDVRGMIYGCLSVVEDIGNDIKLKNIKASTEKPNLPFRAIKFDLPWDTYRHSTALDLHIETCKDLKYWEAFLDMMAGNRFNALSLWNLHPYSYMLRAKNFPEVFSDWHQNGQ
jgi:hypothetical protein